jgi:gliding motility-associated-like protein
MRSSIQFFLFATCLAVLTVLFTVASYGQLRNLDQWTWMSGDNTPDNKGIYGTKGIASANNKPGARDAAGNWKDTDGNLWLFGGSGSDVNGNEGYLNDLWKYDIAANTWTWIGGENTVSSGESNFGIKGIGSVSNWPGARDSRSVSCTDEHGNFWLFGGYNQFGGPDQLLNDLWKFDPRKKIWTWMGGDNRANQPSVGTKGVPSLFSTPSSRHSLVCWSDGAGNIWIFGGAGVPDGAYNDLWKFNIASRLWTWVSGDQLSRRAGKFGGKGIGSIDNVPGGRFAAMSWNDAGDHLWLFGGFVVYRNGEGGKIGNDLWKYDISAKEWTWVSGDSIPAVPGSYGTKGLEATSNKPGNRAFGATWNDRNNNLWLFGGYDTLQRRYNDLWRFNIGNSRWTWVSGDNSFDQVGNYGAKGVTASNNKPGNKWKHITWTDGGGNFWMFGGSGEAAGNTFHYNDLWTYGAFKCSPPTGTISMTPPSGQACFGDSVKLTATGGTKYQWFLDDDIIPGATTSVYFAKQEGVYSVKLNPGTCEALVGKTAEVKINSQLKLTAESTLPICPIRTAVVEIKATGGTGGSYTYSMDSGLSFQNSAVFRNVVPGDYILVIQNGGCKSTETPFKVPPTESSVTATLTNKKDVPCSGGDSGSVTVTGNGGTAPYTYRFQAFDFQPSGNFKLPAGTFTMTARDAKGCEGQVIVTISNVINTVLATVTSTTPSACGGGNTGSAVISGGGGTAPYTFTLGSGTPQATGTFNNLAAGSHTVTVKDASGCTKEITFNIEQANSTVTATVTSTTPGACGGGNTGSAVIAGGGGTAPYTFTLGTGTPQATGTFNNLAAGSHTVTVKDARGCTKEVTFNIEQANNTVTATVTSTTPGACGGGNTGSAVIAGGGGTAPYTFTLGSGTPQATGTFNNLAAGSHTATVKDASGCTKEVTFNIEQANNTVTATVTSTTPGACGGGNTGSAVIAGGGGTGPYTFTLGSGTPQATGTFNNLAAGSHTVTVKDARGCTKEVTFNIIQSNNTLIAEVPSTTPVSCNAGNDGIAIVSASGGTAPYTFTLENRPPQPSGEFKNLSAGNHTVTVRDASGCSKDVRFAIAQAANTITASASSNTISCSGGNAGTVTVAASGGIAPYQYKLGSGPYQESPNFNNLSAGQHVFTVKDAKGCIKDVTAIITQADNTIVATLKSKTEVPCIGGSTGSAVIVASGGTGSLSYTLGTGSPQSNGSFNGLAVGNYSVTVKDGNGCSAIVSFDITTLSGIGGSISPANPEPVCVGSGVELTATEGDSYQWTLNDVNVPGANTRTFNSTQPGRYRVFIKTGSCAVLSTNTVVLTNKACTNAFAQVATAFTPNANNKNDKLTPIYQNIAQLKYFRVFNRWGQKVFETNVLGEGWDGFYKGEKQPLETYTWILECVDTEGKTIRKSGKTILIR